MSESFTYHISLPNVKVGTTTVQNMRLHVLRVIPFFRMPSPEAALRARRTLLIFSSMDLQKADDSKIIMVNSYVSML